METKTREALEGSIEKWEKIVRGEGKDEGGGNCPLCVVHVSSGSDICPYCPVRIKSGRRKCRDTPYEEWLEHQGREHRDSEYHIVHCPTCKDLAQQEVVFLKSLREPEKKAQPEPQAGDVWIKDNGGLPVLFYGSKDRLGYIYTEDGMKGDFKVDKLIERYEYTRIFSLSEYLKNKEESK